MQASCLALVLRLGGECVSPLVWRRVRGWVDSSPCRVSPASPPWTLLVAKSGAPQEVLLARSCDALSLVDDDLDG